MVVTRNNPIVPSAEDDAQVRAAYLARDQAPMLANMDNDEGGVARHHRAPIFGTRVVPAGDGVDTMNVMLNMISHMQVELRELRRKRGGSATDSEGDEDDLDRTIPAPLDHTRDMTAEEKLSRSYQDLLPAVCHDPRFRSVLDYRYYRLHKRSNHYDAKVAATVAKMSRQMEASFKLRFDGSDTLSVLQFLNSFVETADTNGVREGAALYVLRAFLDTPAREEFTAFKASSFPEAVDWMLSTFAPVSFLAAEYKRICSLTQNSGESPREFSLRLRQSASRLGPLMDEAAVTILLEGLDPSLSGFVQSALKNQKPTFTLVIQEAEMVYSSVRATERRFVARNGGDLKSMRPAILTNPNRARENLRPYREAVARPVLTSEWVPEHSAQETHADIGDGRFEAIDPHRDFDEEDIDRADQVMIAHLSNPQQSRYCYTCWRPGHFSANCPLIPEGERAAIARRRADIMRLRDQRQHYTREPQHGRTHYKQTPTPVPVSVRAPVAKAPTKEAVGVIYDSPEKGQLASDQTRPCESQ
jgi:hypothetical protein